MSRRFQSTNSDFLQSSAPLSGGSVTLACWMRRRTVLSGTQILLGLANSTAPDNHMMLALNTSGLIYARKRHPNVTNAVTSTATTINQWAHAAAVFQAGDDFAAYFDGTDKGTASSTDVPSGLNRLSVGRLSDSTPGGYLEDADVAEAAVWDVALTDAQIQSLAAGACPLLVQPDRLVAYQPLVRDLNWRRIGPAMADFGATTVTAHPPILYPGSGASAMSSGALPGAGTLPGADIFGSTIIIPSRRVA